MKNVNERGPEVRSNAHMPTKCSRHVLQDMRNIVCRKHISIVDLDFIFALHEVMKGERLGGRHVGPKTTSQQSGLNIKPSVQVSFSSIPSFHVTYSQPPQPPSRFLWTPLAPAAAMATTSSAVLGPNFLRAVRSCRPQTFQSLRTPPAKPIRAVYLHTTGRRSQQEAGYQRYGPAASQDLPPPPKPSKPFLPSTEQTKNDATELETKKAELSENRAKEDAKSEEHEEEEEEPAISHMEVKDQQATPESSKADEVKVEDNEPLPNKELDMVLSVPSPSEVRGQTHRHPHLEASPYEHHFDTYSLVRDLAQEPDDFNEEQAVTLMKSVRLMLAENLDLAKESLVSKSETENETYLFRAACSELKTTMQTSRFMEAQKQRTSRAQLQHEYDILNQKVSQDIMTLREELKGMFNDRKLHLEEGKRKVDGDIQQLSYKISVDLNSEAKSEVEGLRWVLTRRAALTIGAAATMVLSFLQYYSVKAREQAEIEKKRKAAKKAQEERLVMEQARFTTPSRAAGTQTDSSVPARDYEESLG